MFVRHMLLADDGKSDPPGIRVRPMDGLEAVSSLSPEMKITTGLTTIFGEIIKNLTELGYDKHNLDAAPYDWRLPIQYLEERDCYFSKLKNQIKLMYTANKNKRVVLMCHSNGNRVAHYFTHWMESKKKGWCKKYIHGFIALAAPYLGAPKMVRAIITGDALGLDVVLVSKAQEAWGRHMGSYPSLLPIQEHLLPSPVLMLYTTENNENVDIDDENVNSTPRHHFHPKIDNCWKVYQLLQIKSKLFTDDEMNSFIQIAPPVISGTWILDESRCDPKIQNFEDYKFTDSNIKNNTKNLISKLFVLFDSKNNKISTAKNGFKEIYNNISSSNHDNQPTHKRTKTVGFPFDQETKVNKKVDVKRKTLLSEDGKLIVISYSFGNSYCVRIFISICDDGNSLIKNIFIMKNKVEVIQRFIRYYVRETPLTPVQQFLNEDDSSIQQYGDYSSPYWSGFISHVIPHSFKHYNDYFASDPLIFGSSEPNLVHTVIDQENVEKYPILNPPVGIDNLWCIYGRDKDTEISFYLSKNVDQSICYHTDADKYSLTKCKSNPAGLLIKEGTAFETAITPQPSIDNLPASGDGTVPYASLSYCKTWKNSKDVNVEIIEVPNQEHTDMLKDTGVIFHILKYVTTGKNEFSS